MICNIQIASKIKDKKIEIQRQKGIPCEEERLFVKNRECLDYEFMSFFAHDFIKFKHFPKGSKLIYIDFDTNMGNFSCFIISQGHLQIEKIMKKLHKLIKLHYIPEETSLMFNGKRLDKNKTLDDYNILYESESKLTFTVNFESRKISGTTFPIFIKWLTGKQLKIEVSSFDLIEMIKYDISLLEGRNCNCRLIFAGIMIEEGYTLGDYSIQKGSTFHAVLRL